MSTHRVPSHMPYRASIRVRDAAAKEPAGENLLVLEEFGGA